jgi:hypothetical protein
MIRLAFLRVTLLGIALCTFHSPLHAKTLTADCPDLLSVYTADLISVGHLDLGQLQTNGRLADLTKADKILLRRQGVIDRNWVDKVLFELFDYDRVPRSYRGLRPTPTVGENESDKLWITVRDRGTTQVYLYNGPSLSSIVRFDFTLLKRVIDPELIERVAKVYRNHRLIEIKNENDSQTIRFSNPAMFNFYDRRGALMSSLRALVVDVNDEVSTLNELQRLGVEFQTLDADRRFEVKIPTELKWTEWFQTHFAATPFSHIKGVRRLGKPTTGILEYARTITAGMIPLAETVGTSAGLLHDLAAHFRGFVRLPKSVWNWYQAVVGQLLESYDQASAIERPAIFARIQKMVVDLDQLSGRATQAKLNDGIFQEKYFFNWGYYFWGLSPKEFLSLSPSTIAEGGLHLQFEEVNNRILEKFRQDLQDNIDWLTRPLATP